MGQYVVGIVGIPRSAQLHQRLSVVSTGSRFLSVN